MEDTMSSKAIEDLFILVLDDDDAIRISLQIYLEDEGFNAYSATSAEEGLEIVKTNEVDLVIVDLRLPEMNGIDFVKESIKISPNTKYIIHSGSLEMDSLMDIMTDHRVSDNFLHKPVSEIEFFKKEILRVLDV